MAEAKKEEAQKEDIKKEEPKKQGLLSKLREATDDKEEQMMILSTFVRLGILVWSGAILTLAYVDLPEAFKMPKQDLDPTFIASVFTGVLATFGVQAGGKKNGNSAPPLSKKDMESLIEKASNTAPGQTIRIESPALKIVSDQK